MLGVWDMQNKNKYKIILFIWKKRLINIKPSEMDWMKNCLILTVRLEEIREDSKTHI